MSIDYGSHFYEEEPLVSTSLLPEDSNENSLRPHTLREYIGQEKAKQNLSIFIEAARRRSTTSCCTARPASARRRSRASSLRRWA